MAGASVQVQAPQAHLPGELVCELSLTGTQPSAFYRQAGFQLDQSHHLAQRVGAHTSAGTAEGRVQGGHW